MSAQAPVTNFQELPVFKEHCCPQVADHNWFPNNYNHPEPFSAIFDTFSFCHQLSGSLMSTNGSQRIYLNLTKNYINPITLEVSAEFQHPRSTDPLVYVYFYRYLIYNNMRHLGEFAYKPGDPLCFLPVRNVLCIFSSVPLIYLSEISITVSFHAYLSLILKV